MDDRSQCLFKFFDYLFAISHVNSYKYVAKKFCPDFIIILALPLN